jgi:CubicO group peptidase (beta-lactamase class C family)
LLLAQRDQLSLDDEARKYITELPDYGSPLTIRHLLTHTSGLRDAFLLHELAAPRDDVFDNDAMVKILTHQRALNVAPATEFQYNNGGYALLASIVKRVSGQSLRAFADANIFKPLGMTHTHFHDDPTMIVPNRASGYTRDAGGLHVALHPYLNRIVGNTGLFTTVRDLLLWEQNFTDVRVGNAALIAEMQTPVISTGWSDTSFYGLGLEIARYRGLRTVGHGGGDPGYSAFVVRYPDQGLAVAVACNLDGIDPAALTRRVADIYLSNVFPAPSADSATATPPRVSLSTEQLESKAGLYRDPSNEVFGRLFVRDGKLVSAAGAGTDPSVELTPVSANRFALPGTSIAIEFVPAAAGRPQEIHVTGAGPKPIVMQQVTTSFAPSSTDLSAFAGEYRSEELEVTYTLAALESSLVIQIPGRSDISLRPIFSDAFHGSVVEVVEFSRDARGIVTGLTLHANGVRSLRFDRVKR